MIAATARLRIERIPLSRILVTKADVRFPATLTGYLDMLIAHPEQDTEPLHVRPHATYAGLFELENGHHRLLANIMAGRYDTVCLIEESTR